MTSYVVIFIVSLLLINVWMYFQQPRMIFYPYRELFQTPADWGLDFEDVTLQTEDGVQLHGWQCQCLIPGKPETLRHDGCPQREHRGSVYTEPVSRFSSPSWHLRSLVD